MNRQEMAPSPDEGRPLENSIHEKKKDAFGVNYGFYHYHEGITSPRFPKGNLSDMPSSLSEQLAVYCEGTAAVNVFGAKAPVKGIITNFAVISNSTTSGTVVLFGTTAGTISTIVSSATPGTYTGSAAKILAKVGFGDTVTVTPTAGSMTCLVTFQF